MTIKNNIPTGYKDSAVGIIPQEWEVKPFKNLGAFLRTNTLSRERMNNVEGLALNIHYGDVLVRYGEILDCSKSAIPWVNNNCQETRLGDRLRNGDIVISDTAEDYTVGKATEVCNVGDNCVLSGLHTMAFRPHKETFALRYLGYYFNSPAYRAQLYSLIQGIKVCSISKSAISNTYILVPPMGEQRKIAEILGVWDEAIEKQSRLIEKLELRKRALMQRLLTGRVRLSGFTTPWQKIKLSEAGIFLSTNTLSREKLNDNDGYIQNIHYGDILVKYSSIVDAQLTAIPYINNGVDISSDYLGNGDIVFSDTAEDSIVGKAIEISNIADNKIVAGLHTMLFRPNKGCYAKHYLGYYINSDAYRKQLAPLIQGIKVCSISKKAISQTVIETPSFPEQKAIAEVLTAADNEIATHRKKLAALRLQKRGLMQQLLTGKKRVKI